MQLRGYSDCTRGDPTLNRHYDPRERRKIKIKKTGKKIVIIGGTYMGLIMLSSAFGCGLWGNQETTSENPVIEFGKKSGPYHERFYENRNNRKQALFAPSEKRSDQYALELGITQLKKAKSLLARYSHTREQRAQKKREIENLSDYLPIAQAAFEKKWSLKNEAESPKQFERRRDEGEIDWELSQLQYKNISLNGETKEFEIERAKDRIEKHTIELQELQAIFKGKWGEEYPSDVKSSKFVLKNLPVSWSYECRYSAQRKIGQYKSNMNV